MSSHDCRVSGCLCLAYGVGEDHVRDAITDFLHHYRKDFDEEVAEGNIEIADGTLNLSIDVYGHGGYRNDAVEALAGKLASIVDGHGHVEFRDYDTPDLDVAVAPYFIGASEEARNMAQLEYGLAAFREWVEPVLGKAAVDALQKQVLARISLTEAVSTVSILKASLNDASSVVDAGPDESYAYQAELELAAGFLEKAEAAGLGA